MSELVARLEAVVDEVDTLVAWCEDRQADRERNGRSLPAPIRDRLEVVARRSEALARAAASLAAPPAGMSQAEIRAIAAKVGLR